MTLACMIAADEDAFICDMAEYYHIFDWRALPVRTVATLACGFPYGSRTNRAALGIKVSFGDLLAAAAVDRLSILVWEQTKDGQKGRNKPKMLVESLLSSQGQNRENETYDTPEAFEAARRKLQGGDENG